MHAGLCYLADRPDPQRNSVTPRSVRAGGHNKLLGSHVQALRRVEIPGAYTKGGLANTTRSRLAFSAPHAKGRREASNQVWVD